MTAIVPSSSEEKQRELAAGRVLGCHKEENLQHGISRLPGRAADTATTVAEAGSLGRDGRQLGIQGGVFEQEIRRVDARGVGDWGAEDVGRIIRFLS